ncbi:MAG: hypothetical protein AAF213_09045 [Pseudomonadota bacterium]
MGISRRHLGFGMLALGVGGTAAYSWLRDGDLRGMMGGHHYDPVDLWGFIGGEKSDFVKNEQVIAHLKRVYGITLDARRAGSVEMVTDRNLYGQGPDFLWPSSAVMVQMARQSGLQTRRDQVVFNSPIVLYSWLPIVEALIAQGLVEEPEPDFYTVDLAQLIAAVKDAQTWSSLGIDQLYGQVVINATDPTKSNSGFMFAGLVANLLTGGVATPDTLTPYLPTVDQLFERMGYKEHSSGKLWNSFINEGMGGKPLVIGYENQLIEFALGQPETWARIKNAPMRPVTLYPRPTVYSAHPLISLSDSADRLITALEDPVLQDIAWSAHGFRGQLGGAGSAQLDIPGVPQQLDHIAPMPGADTMALILNRLRQAS